MTTETGGADQRGVLYPGKLPIFHREPVPDDLSDRVRWIWVPRWDLPAGQRLRQELLPFPASNLVVEPQQVALFGPSTGASYRDLVGRGWAVGALLRPAGAGALCSAPSLIRDTHQMVEAPALHARVSSAMAEPDTTAGRHRAVQALLAWIRNRAGEPSAMALLANDMETLVASDRSILRVEQLAERLGVSVRSLQRLSDRYVGLAPLAVIRRYRLQEAAQRLRQDPLLTVSQVAAELGYSDHAHLSADFRRVLGLSPSIYRRRHQ